MTRGGWIAEVFMAVEKYPILAIGVAQGDGEIPSDSLTVQK